MRRVQVHVVPGEKPTLPVRIAVTQQTAFDTVEEATDALVNGCPIIVTVSDEEVAGELREAIEAHDELEWIDVDPPEKVTPADLTPPEDPEPEPDA